MSDKLRNQLTTQLINFKRLPEAMQSEILRLMADGSGLISVCETLLIEDEKPNPKYLGNSADYTVLLDLRLECIKRKKLQ